MSETLKPCPFCGGAAEMVRRDVEPQGDPYYGTKMESFPECQSCGAVLFDGNWHEGFWETDYKNPVRAIEAWNKRALAAEQALAQAREALELHDRLARLDERSGDRNLWTDEYQEACEATREALRALRSEPVKDAKDGGAA